MIDTSDEAVKWGPIPPLYRERKRIDQFDYETLRDEAKAIDFPDAHLGDLDIDIHPIFDPIREPHLKPYLRLATMYLEERQFLPFWHALLFSTRTASWGSTDKFRARKISLKPTPLTPREENATRFFLRKAANYIHPMEFGNTGDGTRRAYTERSLSDQPLRDGTIGGPRQAQKIVIEASLVEPLDPNMPFKTEERIRAGFYVVLALLHEIAHAIYNLRDHIQRKEWGTKTLTSVSSKEVAETRYEGALETHFEPFFEDSLLAELGLAAEHFLWGAHLDFIDDFAPGGQRCILYAVKVTALDYSKTIRVKGESAGYVHQKFRGVQRAWQSEYVVPFEWIQQQFTKAFWESEVSAAGRMATKVPKGLGFRRFNSRWEGGESGIPEEDSSRVRHADDEGVIGRGAGNVELFDGLILSHPYNRGYPFVDPRKKSLKRKAGDDQKESTKKRRRKI